MNADGSSQTRLTNHPSWDTSPDWRAGSQIDWISKLEDQVSALQDLASVQQTQIGLMEQLIVTLQTLINASQAE